MGKRYIKKNDASCLEDEKYLFQGKVLNAVEADEPNSIRWQDLNTKMSVKVKQQVVAFVVTIGCIVACAYAVRFAETASPGVGAAFCISGKIDLSF